MPYFCLNHENRPELAASLHASGLDAWLVVCLCAEWCNTCTAYQQPFSELASRFPEIHFVWLDIENHADLLGDVDIENFPTLLLQKGAENVFFGTTLPEIGIAQRLLEVQLQADAAQLHKQHLALSSVEKDFAHLRCELRQTIP